MEIKSVAIGAAGIVLAGGLVFAGLTTVNAANTPGIEPANTTTTTTPSSTPEPVVTVEPVAETPVEAPVIEPVPAAPAAPAAPVAPVYVAPAEPAYVAPAPAYVAPAPAPAPAYVAPAAEVPAKWQPPEGLVYTDESKLFVYTPGGGVSAVPVEPYGPAAIPGGIAPPRFAYDPRASRDIIAEYNNSAGK